MTDTDRRNETRRAIRFAALLTLALCAIGVVGIWLVGKLALWRRSMFFEQFADEGLGIAILAIAAIAMLALVTRPGTAAPSREWQASGRFAIVVALAVLVVVRVGAAVVFHDYALIDDEYEGLFQATIYAGGHAKATVAQPWCEWIDALTPTGIVASQCTWSLSYFPVNALIRAGFMALHLSSFAQPVMAAATILLLFDICRRLWPGAPERAAVAVLLLACSSQFLLMSMSAFSMPAHLLASAIWIWLFVRPERWALILLPWVGVIALGVHSPYPHVLFVTPLVLRYLVERRFAAFVYVSIVYAVGSVAWVSWFMKPGGRAAAAAVESAGTVAATASGTLLHPRGEPLQNSLASVIIGTWNVPIALLAFLVAVLLWKRLDTLTKWLAASFIFTFLARSVFFMSYGAGWGHRYIYAALVCFAIVASAGLSLMAEAMGRRRMWQVLAASILVAALVQLPMRGMQAAAIARPYREASRFLASIPADVVIVQFQSLQWGRQLLRNDPFLRASPKLMDLSNLTAAQRDSLERTFPGRVRYVRPEEITVLGVKPASRIGRFEIR